MNRHPGARVDPLPFFNGLKLIAESAVIAALQTAFLALAFASFYQVFQTTRALNRLLTALRATLVPLHAQLVFSLARNRQKRELVFDAFSHFIPFPTGKKRLPE
jgi:chromate transport protein ChrA